jgi:predicted RNA methylase
MYQFNNLNEMIDVETIRPTDERPKSGKEVFVSFDFGVAGESEHNWFTAEGSPALFEWIKENMFCGMTYRICLERVQDEVFYSIHYDQLLGYRTLLKQNISQDILFDWLLKYARFTVKSAEDTVESVLRDSKCNEYDTRLILPKYKISNYEQVKKLLVKAGGKYGRGGFTFANGNASKVKEALINGEDVNPKKKFQQFYTPKSLADNMRSIVLNHLQGVESPKFLDPSAGCGALIDGLENVTAVEIDPNNVKYLENNFDIEIYEGDFLKYHPNDLGLFDAVIMNPPFTKSQDVKHILHAYEFLKDGGILVAISSVSWTNSQFKINMFFKDWLRDCNADVSDIDAKTFKDSGTNITTKLLVIKKI